MSQGDCEPDRAAFSSEPSRVMSGGSTELQRIESDPREWEAAAWVDGDTSEVTQAELVMESDASGKTEVVYMLRKIMDQEEVELDPAEEETDSSGRYAYLLECRRTGVRPCLSALMQLSSSMLLLPHFGLVAADCAALAVGVYCNQSITNINFSGNNIGEDASVYLARAVAANAFVREVRLRETGAGMRGAEAWASTLGLSKSLTMLDLRGNKVGDLGGAALAEALPHSVSLISLDLSDNKLALRTARALAKALANNRAGLTSLDVSWNHFRPPDARLLLASLIKNSSLRALNLSWNGIGKDAVSDGRDTASAASTEDCARRSGQAGSDSVGGPETLLADLLRSSRSLTDLDVSNCRLGAGACHALAGVLRQNTGLQFLQLDGNRLGPEAALLLAQLNERVLAGTLVKFSANRVGVDPTLLAHYGFDRAFPTGHYRLVLADPAQRAVADSLAQEAIARDTDIFRNERIDGLRCVISLDTLKNGWEFPATGYFETDVIAFGEERGTHSEVMDADNYRLLSRLLEVSTNEQASLTLLRQACQGFFLDLSQAMLLLFKFSRDATREAALMTMVPALIEGTNMFLLLHVLAPQSRLEMQRRVGPLHFMNRHDPAGKYAFDLAKAPDRRALRLLTALKRQNLSSTFENAYAPPNLLFSLHQRGLHPMTTS